MELVAPDNTIAINSACNASTGRAQMRLQINESTKLGEYKCRYPGQDTKSAESLKISYRLCDDRSATCWSNANGCSDRNKLCVIGTDGPKQCSEIRAALCVDTHQRRGQFCPGNKGSWCEAFTGTSDRPTAWISEGGCQDKEQTPKTKMENEAGHEVVYEYNQPFLVSTSAHILTIFVGGGALARSNVTCEVVDRNGTNVLDESFVFRSFYDLNLSAVVNRSSQIFKLRCTLKSTVINTNTKAWLSNILVILAGDAKITPTLAKNPQYTDSLKCHVDPAPSKDINVSYAWFRNKTGFFSNEPTINIEESDEYRCEADLSYITCSPYWRLGPYNTKSKSFKAVAAPKPATTTSPKQDGTWTGPGPGPGPWSSGNSPTTTKDDENRTRDIAIGVSVSVVAVIVLTVVVAIFVIKRRSNLGKRTSHIMTKSSMMKSGGTANGKSQSGPMSGKSQKGPPEDLLKLANDPNAFNLVQLAAWAADRITKESAASKNDAVIQKWVARAHQDTKELTEKGMLVHPEGSRYGNIDTRKDTMVLVKALNNKPMPFNAIEDFNRNTILLGQAPKKEGGASDHWMMMYQEKVGVMVWVGDLMGPKNEEKIYPYVPMEEGQKARIGKFEVIATNVVKNQNGCDTYVLDVKPEGQERRHMTMIHITQWPDHNAPSVPLEMANAVIHVADQQAKRAATGLPTLLVHCSAGVQRSVATVVCLIGRQMWLSNGTVHPMGILDYVRSRRYKALAVPPEQVNTQLALMGGVLQVICTRATEQMVGLNKIDSKREKGVFDRKGREKDLAKVRPKSIAL